MSKQNIVPYGKIIKTLKNIHVIRLYKHVLLFRIDESVKDLEKLKDIIEGLKNLPEELLIYRDEGFETVIDIVQYHCSVILDSIKELKILTIAQKNAQNILYGCCKKNVTLFSHLLNLLDKTFNVFLAGLMEKNIFYTTAILFLLCLPIAIIIAFTKQRILGPLFRKLYQKLKDTFARLYSSFYLWLMRLLAQLSGLSRKLKALILHLIKQGRIAAAVAIMAGHVQTSQANSTELPPQTTQQAVYLLNQTTDTIFQEEKINLEGIIRRRLPFDFTNGKKTEIKENIKANPNFDVLQEEYTTFIPNPSFGFLFEENKTFKTSFDFDAPHFINQTASISIGQEPDIEVGFEG